MGMTFYGLVVLMLCRMSQALSVPVDAVKVQYEQRVAVGAHEVTELVLLNGVYLTNREAKAVLQWMSADFHPLLHLSSSNSSLLKNHTVVRSRECILEGSQLQWVDRVSVGRQIYLTQDRNDAWVPYVPQAVPLKTLWEQVMVHPEEERLEVGCVTLMRELSLSQEHSVTNVPQLLIPLLAFLAFIGLVAISLLLSKTHGLRHPGGVIGSVIHYPKDIAEVPQEMKGGYRTL
ncbi:uncharacterized protein LOC128769489 [Synchiropus splendidus]|uniref:uncharacterized protein LOC128769489 n=1 Tax=Synchiropus splendidus TaxID=270530 RepID=UPI00237D81E6|nr:uncharacterized protein LOC128769489 [Synchiropus splendidus]